MSDDEIRLLALGLPPPGTLLAGRYRVERLLGVGGMGAVLLARHELLDQWVALKLLHAGGHADPEKVARFFNEARAAARITGDHVVRVHDVGQLEDGRPYMCMEYLQGMDLGQWMRSSGEQFAVPTVVATLLDASDALAQAHAMGVVHRDLKPSNLYLVDQADGARTLKVLDFGIAKMQNNDGSGSELTQTGTIMGTPAYMAPEQMRSSRRTDHRADIWALGVIAFELLSRSKPFAGESLGDILFSIAERPATPLHQLVPDVPPELASIVARCLERDPEARFASIAELAAALEPFAPPGYRSSRSLQRHVVAARASHADLSSPAFASAPTAHDPGSQGSAPRLDAVHASVIPSARSSSFRIDRPRSPVVAILTGVVLFAVVAVTGAALWIGHGRRTAAAGGADSTGSAGISVDAAVTHPPANGAMANGAMANGENVAPADTSPPAAPPSTVSANEPVDAGARGRGGRGRITGGRQVNPAAAPPGMASDPDWSGVNNGAPR